MQEKIKKIVPNIITLSRIVALVIGFVLFVKGKIVEAICLYIYGSVSDAFDGYFARKWNAYTKLGGYLDAISDKFYALSIFIISIIYGNYSILIVAHLELTIAIINYLIIRKNGSAYTERVGKFKMTFEFVLLIVSLLTIKFKAFWYLYIILFILTVYLQIQSINAYINQKNNKKSGKEVNYTGKSAKEKARLLLSELKYYLIHPVKIIK